MKNLQELVMSLSPEFRRTIEDGYIIPFFIRDGFVCMQTFPGIKYLGSMVKKEARPCATLQANIIRITLPHDIKGYAIVSWKQLNDE